MNKNKIISNVLWKFAERTLAQIIGFAVSVVLARLLEPDDYGLVAMVTVFIIIGDVFVTSGITAALIQKKDADEKDFSSVFFFNLVLSCFIYMILFIIAPYIGDFYHENLLSPIIRIMGLRVIIASVNSIQHSYVARNMLFKKYFWSTFYGSVLSGVVGIILAYYGLGVWALVSQYMLNSIVDTVILFITVNWRPVFFFSIKRLIGMVKFGWRILFEGLSNTITSEMNNLIIGRVYTSADLGYYTTAQKLPSGLVSNIGVSISSVLFPVISQEQDDIKKVKEILRKSIRISSYIVFPMLFGFGIIAKEFVCLIMTDKWIGCVPYLRLYCVANLITVGLIPRHQALNGIGRSDIFMLEHIAGRIINLILLIGMFRISIMAIAISGIIGTCILAFTVMYTSKKYNGYGYYEQIQDVMPSIFGCLIMYIPLIGIQSLNLSALLSLFVQVILGCILYIIYSKLFKVHEFVILKDYFIKLLRK